jgi:hypothetical protein
VLGADNPDVIVSTVGPTITRYGTNGGITGYAVTTVSCNIGTADAIWIRDTSPGNRHPVIGQEIYRLWNGKFEQIGQSWLKHGFCAADAPNCLNLARLPNPVYRSNASCDWLGLYATDTYSASLNGSQSNLGPRSEVNATTGAYPYPYIRAWGQTGNCIFKRMQVANADLDPANFPGARFFIEVHYVTTDEPAENRFNNASYRECVIQGQASNGTSCTSDGMGFNLVFPTTNPTIPMKTAVEGWHDVDPTVSILSVDIPHDGRVLVAYKVTDRGNGTWAYEYAIYNHNSDRSIGSFSIPKPSNAAAAFTELGFHDVGYHSGEVYDGTDWPSTVGTDNIGWSTTPYATNQNANAIRWSTTYNFRFVSNRPPAAGTVTLGLFKPGIAGDANTVNVPGVFVPSAPCAADFNGVGGVTVQDVFDFVGAFVVSDPSADFNHSNGVSVQDLYDYLGAYFTAAGC